MLGGQLDLTISVVPLAGGQYFAALDVPAQKVSRMVTEVTVRGDSVLLWMPAAGSRYAAHFDAQKRELNGIWTQAGTTGSCPDFRFYFYYFDFLLHICVLLSLTPDPLPLERELVIFKFNV